MRNTTKIELLTNDLSFYKMKMIDAHVALRDLELKKKPYGELEEAEGRLRNAVNQYETAEDALNELINSEK